MQVSSLFYKLQCDQIHTKPHTAGPIQSAGVSVKPAKGTYCTVQYLPLFPLFLSFSCYSSFYLLSFLTPSLSILSFVFFLIVSSLPSLPSPFFSPSTNLICSFSLPHSLSFPHSLPLLFNHIQGTNVAKSDRRIACLTAQGVSESNVLEYMGCIEQRAAQIIHEYSKATNSNR